MLTASMAAALLITGPVRIVLGLILILVLPGYVLVAAFFPAKKDLDWIERVALSVGLSIAVVPLLGLLLNFTPWGIRLDPIMAALAIFIAGVGLLAYWRRMRLPTEDRLELTLEVGRPAWGEYSALDKTLTVSLVLSLITAGGVLAYVVAVPRPGERFTEFYILGPGGKAEKYPTNLTPGAIGTVIVGVVNHEGRLVNYTVAVSLEEYNVTRNATGALVKSLVGSSLLDQFPILLQDSGRSERNVSFFVPQVGLFRFELQLFIQGSTAPYRELHLWVNGRA